MKIKYEFCCNQMHQSLKDQTFRVHTWGTETGMCINYHKLNACPFCREEIVVECLNNNLYQGEEK